MFPIFDMIRFLAIFSFILFGAVCGNHVSYEGYNLWSVTPLTEGAAKKLSSLEAIHGLDIWMPSTATGKRAKIIVPPEKQEFLKKLLAHDEFKGELIVKNLELALKTERENQKLGIEKLLHTGFSVNNSLPIDHFWTYDEINRYVNYLVRNYSHIIQAEQVGRSAEARMIKAYKISLSGKVDGSRPIIFIDATIHAREWATPVSAMYLLHQLVEKSANHDFLKHVDWIIVPVVNPDGYIYSHEKDRLWRRNRRKFSKCIGVDLNRNFGHYFERTDECYPAYSGPYAFSEPESRAIRRVLEKYHGKIKLYASLHSWGPMVLYPWGFDNVLADNWKEHQDVGDRFAKAVAAKTQTIYEVGNAAGILYPVSGGSEDYVFSRGVNLSFTLEINGYEPNGFHPTPEQLHGIVIETFAGLAEFGKYVAVKYIQS